MAAVACLAGSATAQRCYSDEHHRQMLLANPELAQADKDYEEQIQAALKHIDFSKLAKVTASDDKSGDKNWWYEIPLVVHIIHDYGTENITDDNIFNYVKEWNQVFAKQNADTSEVIAPFKKWIGNSHIRLRLATKDPNGNPTKGITRRRSYMTYNGLDQAKFDVWAPTSYLNIWSIQKMGASKTGAAAYAQFPTESNSAPFYDGVISLASYLNADNTINHEIGHCMTLYHVWGNVGVATACGDDGVDDTPPTRGHNTPGCQYALPSSNLNSTYDSACATNYFKIYPKVLPPYGDSLVNYPDTSNAQNIMDYTYCSKMFTIGQVERMHACLNSTTAGRKNLWDSANLQHTGVYDENYNIIPRRDLKPIPEFSIHKNLSTPYMDRVNYFTFPGVGVAIYNETWNDTVSALNWTFSNGASSPTSTSKTNITNSFTTPGWVSITMTATGNHTGDTTRVWPNALFVAEATGTPAANVFQEFNPSGDVAKWPSFNYYNNEFKWQVANTGKYDGFSLQYTGYDHRINTSTFTYPTTGNPYGDFDDFFTTPVDFTGYAAGSASLNFDYSGASRSSTSTDINDTLIIDYTINKGTTWQRLLIMSKGALCNKGAVSTPYTPGWPSDWAHQAIDLPAAALSPYTTFRFRYRPGVHPEDMYGRIFSTGNNFFMDNISFKQWSAEASNVMVNNANIAIVPNPTNGDAYVILKDADNTMATVTVSDITGKVVYTTHQQINGNEGRIVIPRSSIPVAGMYLVQTTTGSNTNTQKLVVY